MKPIYLIFASIINLGVQAQTTTVTLVRELNSNGDADPRFFTTYAGKMYFSANHGSNGRELCYTNGGTAVNDTNVLRDIFLGSSGSTPSDLKVFKNKLYFTAQSSTNNREMWVTDGTYGNTVQCANIHLNGSSNPSELTEFNGHLYFKADNGISGEEVWSIDGLSSSATMLMSQYGGINTGAANSSPANFTPYGGKLYFTANNGDKGRELWCTNGNSNWNETYMVSDINPGSGDASPSNLFEFKGALFFTATGPSGNELYFTDGNSVNTKIFRDLNPGNAGSNPRNFVKTDNYFLFSANDGVHGVELWISDGSSSGTMMLKNINATGGSSGSNSSFPSNFTIFHNKVYFNADGKLWMTDGTFEGTKIVTTAVNAPGNMQVYKDRLYFKASPTGENNTHLWSIDDNHQPVMHAPMNSSKPSPLSETNEFYVYDDSLYFAGNYNDNIGIELYKLTYIPETLSIHPMANATTTIYPNPATDFINVAANKPIRSLSVYQMSGTKVLTTDSTNLKIDISALISGVYWLQIQYRDGDQQTTKFIKR